jgi:hypothetical protein
MKQSVLCGHNMGIVAAPDFQSGLLEATGK